MLNCFQLIVHITVSSSIGVIYVYAFCALCKVLWVLRSKISEIFRYTFTRHIFKAFTKILLIPESDQLREVVLLFR